MLDDIGRALVLDRDVRDLLCRTLAELALVRGDDLIKPRGDHRVAWPLDDIADGVQLLQER
jgi:hypothetical protein